jgi:DNA-binding MarR family transcriptional regulator
LTVKELVDILSHMTERFQDLVMPVLLREARDAYTSAIRRGLTDAGYDDMPRAGARVIGRIARAGVTVQDVGNTYGVSRQAASQLVDSLVLSGYVAREADPTDRRRMNVTLTERGAAAAEEIRRAIEEVDAALQDLVQADDMQSARRVLGVLAAIRYGEDPAPELA